MSTTSPRVLVTGASGMLGSHIVDRLVDAGADVLATDLAEPVPGYAWRAEGVEFRNADITRAAAELVSGVDSVVHVAAMLPSPSDDRRRAMFDVNVLGTHRLFEAAAEHGVRVVFASSGSVYGASRALREGRPAAAFTEADAVLDLDFYGLSKRVDELYADAFGRVAGLAWNSLRCGVLYGPRLRMGLSTRFLLSVMDDLDAGRVPVVDGDPDAGLDWIFAEDAAECFARAALREPESGALNVATGVATRLEDVLLTLTEVAGAPPVIDWTGASPSGGFSGARYYDPTRTRRALGVDLSSDIRHGLEEFVAWHREVRAPRDDGAARR